LPLFVENCFVWESDLKRINQGALKKPMKTNRFVISLIICISAAVFSQPVHLLSAQTPTATQTAISNSTPSASSPVSEQDRRYYENVMADHLYDWKQPIILYGKVLDENGQPVSNAVVNFEWTDLSANGSSKKQCGSDAAGLFTIRETGKRLCLTVSKAGYYSTRDARSACFEFANPADGLFKPDIANPVVFHLKKRGTTEPLKVHQVFLAMTEDDQPLAFDPVNSKLSSNGPIILNLLAGETNQLEQADMRFRITVKGGGIQMAEGEFAFLAPENGYQSSVEINVSKDAIREVSQRKYQYYLFLGEPRIYGRILVEIPVFRPKGKASLPVTYWINPSGSRNLEYDPDIFIKTVPTHYLQPGTPLIDTMN
jgi:hypothetical protein